MADGSGCRLRTGAMLVLFAAAVAGCSGSPPDEQVSAAGTAPEPGAAPSAGSRDAPPFGPSLWVLIDRPPVPGDPELVQAIARIDPATDQELDRLEEVGYNPRELTYADGTLCVHNVGYSAITCVDAGTHETVRTLEFGHGFTSYTRGGGAFWATEVGTGLVRVDAASGGRTVAPADLVPSRLAFADGVLWVLNTSMTITRVDPGSGMTLASIPTRVGDDLYMPLDIAAAGNAVWVTTSSGDVLRIDPATNEIVARLSGAASRSETEVLIGVRTRVVADAVAAWVVGIEDGSVLRIDAASNATSVAAALQPPVHDIAVGIGAVWVLHGESGSITRVDPATGAATPVGAAGRGAIGIIAR